MHDAYDPTPGTARCPHCPAVVSLALTGPWPPGLHRALLDLLCPLGHVWHEVRTATSRDRYWQPLDDWGAEPAHPSPASAVRLPASPRVPQESCTPV